MLIKNKPEVTQKEIFAIFESQQQAKKAIEGCLVKNFITTIEDHKYAATPEGKNQI